MLTTLTIKINLPKDEEKSPREVAFALRKLADKLDKYRALTGPKMTTRLDGPLGKQIGIWTAE